MRVLVLSHVHEPGNCRWATRRLIAVTWPAGGTRVYDTVSYCLLTAEALEGSTVRWVTRRDALALLARRAAA